eukprot:3614327-Rhodomonas_salina.1
MSSSLYSSCRNKYCFEAVQKDGTTPLDTLPRDGPGEAWSGIRAHALGCEVEGVIREVVGNESEVDSEEHVAVPSVVVELAGHRNQHEEDEERAHPDGERGRPAHLHHPAVYVQLPAEFKSRDGTYEERRSGRGRKR